MWKTVLQKDNPTAITVQRKGRPTENIWLLKLSVDSLYKSHDPSVTIIMNF